MKNGSYSVHDCYPIDSTCSEEDTNFNCIAWYVTQYACDTTYEYDYTYDTIGYNNYTFGSVPYTYKVDSGAGLTPTACGISMDPIWNSITSGSNNKGIPSNSSMLTITGQGFGVSRGKITVSDASTGGKTRITLDSVDIKIWTNNRILIKMPSVILGSLYMNPGSGPLSVHNACGDSVSQPITIKYGIIDDYAIGTKEKLRANIAMVNPNNSLVFRCDTSITKNPAALGCIRKAIREWNCYTGVHWILGADTILEKTDLDGVSNIYFSDILSDSSAVMVTVPEAACANFADSVLSIYDADISILRNPNLPWNYDTTGAVVGYPVYYFYDLILHELGHAHLLKHVNDSTSLMWYKAFTTQRVNIKSGTWPGPQTLYGAQDVINTSISVAPKSCIAGILMDTMTGCRDSTMSVINISGKDNSLTVFPNPIHNEDITVTYQLKNNAYIQFKITDCIGREVVSLANEHEGPGTYSLQINTDALAEGVYLLVANFNGEYKTIKFIKI